SSTVSQEPSEGKVTYVPGQSITLRCNSTEYKEFKWYRSKYVIANGTYNYGNFAESIVPSYSLSATDPKAFEPIIPNDDDVFEIRNERLRIPRANQSYIRDYKCQALRSDHDDSPKIEVTHEAAIFQVRAQPYIVDFDIATSHTRRSGIVTDGDRLEINCEVRSENQGPVNITWVKSRISDDESSYDEIPNDSSNDHIEIYNTNTFTRTLVIESVTLSDRSYYMCVANNNVTNVTTKTIFIRVKDKLIAFWPFVVGCGKSVVTKDFPDRPGHQRTCSRAVPIKKELRFSGRML
ncbi:hypothetical protein GZH46_00300, partial [Fragariocoptes setiger]